MKPISKSAADGYTPVLKHLKWTIILFIPDTFVYTGDIHAMWLRVSGAQVWPYIQLANKDPELKKMLEGVLCRQFKCINIDPYAHAFNDGAVGGEWMSDLTDMKPELHERKWEIHSDVYKRQIISSKSSKISSDGVSSYDWISSIMTSVSFSISCCGKVE